LFRPLHRLLIARATIREKVVPDSHRSVTDRCMLLLDVYLGLALV